MNASSNEPSRAPRPPCPSESPLTSDAILLLDEDARIIEANEAFAQLLQTRRSELLGQRLDALDPRHSPPWLDRLGGAVETSTRLRLEVAAPDDGPICDVEFLGNPFVLRDERLVLWTGRNITEQRQLEREAHLTAHRILKQNEILAQVAVSDAVHEADLPRLARHITEAVGLAFDIDVASVWLIEQPHEGEHLTPIAIWDRDAQAHVDRAPVPSRRCALTLAALAQHNYIATLDPNGAAPPPCAVALRSEGVITFLDGVIRASGQPHGLLRFERRAEPHAWRADEIAFVCQLGDQIGMALANREHRAAEERLRQSEDNYRQLFEAESDAIVLIDNATGQIIAANQATSQLYGYSHAELTQMRNVDLSAEPTETRHVTVSSPPAIQTIVHIPVRWHRKKDGTRFPVEITGRFFVQRGRPVHIAAIRDITERLRVEEELHKSEERYRRLVELSTNAIVVHQRGLVVYANPAAVNLMAANTPEELLGKPILDFVTPEFQAIAAERMRKVIERQHTEPPLEERLVRLDGEVISVEITATPFEFKGEPAIQVIVHDLSARKEMEQRLRQSEKMDAVGQLAGGIAHDFNNQLSAILGFADLLAMQLSDPALKQHADAIIAAASRSAELTSQLLAFSRKGRYNPAPVDIHAIIDEACLILERSIGKKISITRLYDASPSIITADSAQLQSALLNLGINARDAMPDGGVLTFATATLHQPPAELATTDGVPTGDLLVLTVKDTGIGMDAQTRHHIFEPFFTTKGPGHGTGLGLAAVYGTIKGHGGTIDVTTAPGAGSTFRICLPMGHPVVENHPESLAVDPPLQRARILVVDDEDAVRATVVGMLESLGHEVHACADGLEAVTFFQQHCTRIDLVILDMVMPFLDGPETFARLHEIDPEVKILLSSGYSVEGKATDLIAHGGQGFLQKPFRIKDLQEKLQHILSSRSME